MTVGILKMSESSAPVVCNTVWHEILAGVIIIWLIRYFCFFFPRLADFNLADRSRVDAYT